MPFHAFPPLFCGVGFFPSFLKDQFAHHLLRGVFQDSPYPGGTKVEERDLDMGRMPLKFERHYQAKVPSPPRASSASSSAESGSTCKRATPVSDTQQGFRSRQDPPLRMFTRPGLWLTLPQPRTELPFDLYFTVNTIPPHPLQGGRAEAGR